MIFDDWVGGLIQYFEPIFAHCKESESRDGLRRNAQDLHGALNLHAQ